MELQRSIKMRQRLQKEAEERAAASLLKPTNAQMSMNMNSSISGSGSGTGSKSPIIIELQNKKIENK